MKKTAAIILAGGKGTRFNEGKPSLKPKVLYEVNGVPIIKYSLEILEKIGVGEIVIVVGHKGDDIKNVLGPKYIYAIQEEALGTGDAASKGLKKISDSIEDVIVLYGADIYAETVLREVLDIHSKKNPKITFITMLLENPSGFGRIVRGEEGRVQAIVEDKVATEEQKIIKEVNDGCYILNKDWLVKNINSLSMSKVREYFLTDLVELAIKEVSEVEPYTIKNTTDWIGIDSLEDIKNAEEIIRGKK